MFATVSENQDANYHLKLIKQRKWVQLYSLYDIKLM